MIVLDITEQQKQLFDAVNILIDNQLTKENTTNTRIGLMLTDPVDGQTQVMLSGVQTTCLVSENMLYWVQKGDVVSIQDLYNDGKNLYVVGKMGNEMDEPSLVFANQYDDKIYSGVDGMFDDELNEKITHGMVGEEWKDDNTQS